MRTKITGYVHNEGAVHQPLILALVVHTLKNVLIHTATLVAHFPFIDLNMYTINNCCAHAS